MIHLDTHVALWLHTERVDRLPFRARQMVEEEALAVSPMLELELALLHNFGRLAPMREEVLGQLAEVLGVGRSRVSFPAAVHAAGSPAAGPRYVRWILIRGTHSPTASCS